MGHPSACLMFMVHGSQVPQVTVANGWGNLTKFIVIYLIYALLSQIKLCCDYSPNLVSGGMKIVIGPGGTLHHYHHHHLQHYHHNNMIIIVIC